VPYSPGSGEDIFENGEVVVFWLQGSDNVAKVSGFGFRVLGSRFWVSGFRFRVSGFRFRILDFGIRISDSGCRTVISLVSGSGFLV
jgi:hypothetical protein